MQADMYAADDALDESTAMRSEASRRTAHLRVPHLHRQMGRECGGVHHRIIGSGLLTGLRPGTGGDRREWGECRCDRVHRI